MLKNCFCLREFIYIWSKVDWALLEQRLLDLLSFNPCPRFKKPLGSRKLKALYTVQSAKDICPQLQQISLDTTKTQQYHSIRRLISNAVQAHIEQEVDRSVTTGCAAGGGDMFYANMNQWQQEQSIQHMANKVPSTMLFYWPTLVLQVWRTTSIVLSLLPSTFPIQYKLNFSMMVVDLKMGLSCKQMTDLANDLIIDFTFVEPTARTYGPYKSSRIEKKREENQNWV